MSRHLTIPQAAVVARVRPHVMRAIVEQGRLDAECRLPRHEEGEITARAFVPQHMIDPEDLEALMADKEKFERACDGAFVRRPTAAPPTVSESQKSAAAVRKRLEDRLEAKRIGIPVEEWAL
jgi:hypothetical protein